MHPNETKDKFIELRAQGWSLPRIATEIHVGQRTLVDWTRECADQIRGLCALEMEAKTISAPFLRHFCAISAPFLRDLRQFYFSSLMNQRLTKITLVDRAVFGKTHG